MPRHASNDLQHTASVQSAVLLQPLVLASAVECIGRFFQQQGLLRLAGACHKEVSGKRGGRLGHIGACVPAAASEYDGAAKELLDLAHDLIDLTNDGAAPLVTKPRELPYLGTSLSSGSSGRTTAGGRAGRATMEPVLKPPRWQRSGLTMAHEALSFLWPLLPPFIERPSSVAALAALARLPWQALQDDNGKLCIGHAHLHPNSLGPGEAPTNGDGFGPRRNGILQRISFSSLVSTQFHLPHLPEAFWLLESLTTSSCHSLRKLVDRQSRWRPREQRFETLDEAGLERAAKLAHKIGGLRSLKHLEGPIFSIILRACSQKAAKQSQQALAEEEEPQPASLSVPHAWLEDAVGEGNAADTVRQKQANDGKVDGSGLSDKLEIAYLMDTTKEDLLGFWEPLYLKLHKLVLLNLPSASPGLTVRAVAAFLPKVPNLTELQLDFAFFDPTAWEMNALELLVERVQAEPSKVSKLILEWCRLGDAGIRRVCETFSRFPRGPVSELSLAHCEMHDVTSICEMLETPDLSLTKLDLSSNALDDCQATRLAKALPFSQVKELRLRDSQVSVPLPVKTEWFWGC